MRYISEGSVVYHKREIPSLQFIYRLKYLDGSTAEVTASRDTIILLETLIKYGIIKRITVKS